MRTEALLLIALALASCSTPPKPPTVDESLKRPANSALAVELQVCQGDLHDTHLAAKASAQRAATAQVNLERLAAHRREVDEILQARASAGTPTVVPANTVFTVHFDFASSRVVVPPDTVVPLIGTARAAPLVLLRARTDGRVESAAEARIARERAAAVRDYLVAAGVDAQHIRATWQPVGDHAADNDTQAGRDLNRRVEIEVYRALPVAFGSAAAAAPASP